MWGNPQPANRMDPFRGSQEERFAPGWNRDYSPPPPPLDSLAQERHSGNFSGRESLPFDIQGLPGMLNPQFANREEPTFSFGGRDGPHSDFRGGEGHLHGFGGRDYPPSDFQNRDDSHLDFRGRVPLLPDFRGREMYQGDFQDREGQSMDYGGGDIPPLDYRNRDAFRMNYREREAHTMNYRGRDDAPSDFRARGTFDLDFRNRDGSHPHFRARDMSEQDYRGREQPYSEFRKREMPDTDLRGMSAPDLDFRDRDVPHSNFRNRPKSQTDQDFRGRDVQPPLDFADRDVPSVDPKVVDYQHSHSTVPATDRKCEIEEAVLAIRKRSSFGVQSKEFPHSEPRAKEEESQEQKPETDSSEEFQNSCGPLPTVNNQDKPPQTFLSNQEFSAGEQQVSESSALGLKEKGDLDFLGRQDTDYRGIEYRDVDHRLPGSQLFEYEHGKSFAEGKSSKDSQQDLQDQDYRTGLKDIKPSKLIRLGKVPETATKDDILNAFQACVGTPVKNMRLKDYTTGYDYGYICVEFSLLEEAIACMEANQGHLVIGGKEVTLEYSQSPEFWHCRRCKVSTVGYRSSCYYCRLPRDEEKVEKGEEELPEEPTPEEEPPKEPAPPQEPSPQKPSSEQHSQPQEPEPKKDESREQWPSQEKKRRSEMYPPRKENQEHGSRREATETKHQEDESRTIMLKRIPRFTPVEVIVGLLAPYVRLSTSSVRVMKNKAGRMGYTYGFIELDSHAEALRLVKVLQDLDPPISIDGRAVDVNLATGKRRNEYGDQGDVPRYSQGKRGMSDRRGADSQKRRSESSSDVSTFIYDPDTGNYFDPITGMYYDPNTQREVPMGREASSSSPPHSGRRRRSQDRASERDETSSRDNRERRERHRNKSAKNEPSEEKLPAEDVFKKPLPPTLKKEESAPPPKVVNPLIGLLGEYGGDSDNEEEEEEEPKPQPPRPPVQQEERPQKVENDEDKLTDWNKLACLLCRRQFPNKEVLIKHQQLSNLHKQNLEIHRKIKRSEQELAYLERREREGKFKEKEGDRREKFEERNSPERKRPKYFRNSESDYKPTDKGRMESNNKGSRMMQAMGWKEGSGLGRNEQGMTAPVEPESRKKGAGLGTQARPSRRQSNETYRDAVRRVMFARYKELE
ncbi:RNA-binding protein 6 isoform X2 [Rhineura floridana]|uniref:RNA-binding protein 6 isoform X2 n=1 Tax=Rhineura floridana TaxID=261503 RepID=UPI002AC80F17|nr:RNA-binding protein 6 isoform X2 [Rhineura floridana]